MRLVIQRVKEASVTVEEGVCGKIGKGLLVLLGIHREDAPEGTEWLVQKLLKLRIFSDAEGKLNLDVQQAGGEILVVSQFTLYGDCSKGNRPGFTDAARGANADLIYQKFAREVERDLGKVQCGKFGASMQVSLVNDGPVTLILENKKIES